ncbi:MAG: hypothetical protein ACI88A_001565 [Paraglaciecola sp.]|jgi:hypothetical protein
MNFFTTLSIAKDEILLALIKEVIDLVVGMKVVDQI